MRPAIEVFREAYNAGVAPAGETYDEDKAAAVIEADRLALVAEIVTYLRQMDATRDESNLIGWAANRVQAEFGGQHGDR